MKRTARVSSRYTLPALTPANEHAELRYKVFVGGGVSCLVCGVNAVVEWIDVGAWPVASFYMDAPDEVLPSHHIAAGQCNACGTIQLIEPVSHEALLPPAFVPSREPEGHLDNVVETILSLDYLRPESVIGALTYKDDTTVERFRKKGFGKTWRLELKDDFGIDHPTANIESIQYRTTPEHMRKVAARIGQADLLIVRHITEHAEDVPSFIQGLSELVAPGGLLMLEVPDCTTSLRLRDYCMLWEEHSLYLTPETLRPLASLGGFEPIRLDTYELPFENCLVLLSRKTGSPGPLKIDPAARTQVGLLKDYADAYEPAKQELRRMLEAFRAETGPIALFGAGHIAHAFINYMGIADLIEFIADDTPEKQGKYLSGCGLPIMPSSELVARDVKLCLLALSITNESNVIARNAAFVEAGGRFRSVFRASGRSVFNGPLT